MAIQEKRVGRTAASPIALSPMAQRHCSSYKTCRPKPLIRHKLSTQHATTLKGNGMNLIDFAHAMPKVELHVHLFGAIQPNTLLQLAQANRVDLPATTVEDLHH